MAEVYNRKPGQRSTTSWIILVIAVVIALAIIISLAR